MTCGHLLRVSLIQKRLGEKGVNIHDMTLPQEEPLKERPAEENERTKGPTKGKDKRTKENQSVGRILS